MINKSIILFILTFISAVGIGQNVLERSVVSTAGNSSNSANYFISYTIGETAINHAQSTNFSISEGFQKASSFIIFDPLTFNIEIISQDCDKTNEGAASITNIKGCLAPYTIKWENGSSNSVISDLGIGTHTVTVSAFNGCSLTKTFEINSGENGECDVRFYSGFTPNSDQINDWWIIDNIDKFLSNKLTIYNRYGDIIQQFENYNNSTVVWKGDDKNGNMIADGTYFYVFEANGFTKKGWVEITK